MNKLNRELDIMQEPERPLSMHPQKFALWLFLVSIVMLFAAFTSAYIVRRGEGNWLDFDLPALFSYTSVVIVLSSITMQWAYVSAKKDNLDMLKIALSLTTVLGIAFLVGQWYAWGDLVDKDVYFVGNPSGTFIYVLTGVHGVHLISGVIFLIIVLISSFRYKVHSKSLLRIEMCATYWHFLGALWLYLFFFLSYNQ
jgi:cytochrome c oxidase subunit 3